jgi:parallel beta-helix repeat protein
MRPFAGIRNTPAALACALAGSVFFALPGGVSSATWCVPELVAGCDNAATTIQGAVYAASAGDTVLVSVGRYEEAVFIPKRLNLLGAQAGVDARGRVGSPESTITSNGALINLGPNSAGTLIDGFTFSGGFFGVRSEESAAIDGVQIRNSRFIGFRAGGIALYGSGADITIDRNYVDGSSLDHPDSLVSLRKGGTFNGFWLTNNAILNGAASQGIGFMCIGLGNMGPSATRSPSVKGNHFSALFAGAVLLDAPMLLGEIRENTFDGNDHGINAGLRDTLLTRNTFQNNTSFGMMLAPSSRNNTIRANEFVGNGSNGTGFGLSGTFVASEITDNQLINNGTGLMGQLTSTTVARNVFRENVVDGANLFSGAVDSTITENEFVLNSKIGLLGTLSSTLVERNIFRDNGVNGLSFTTKESTPNGDNEVLYNQFLANGAAGINQASPNSAITDNAFVGNGHAVTPPGVSGAIHGIGPAMLVERNLLVDNYRFALFVGPNAAGSMIEGNLLRRNGEPGPCAAPAGSPEACGAGVFFGARSPSFPPAILGNSIIDNRVGAVINPPAPLPYPDPPVKDMRHNYWGTTDGPAPIGSGNAVIATGPATILFDPWLTSMPAVPHMLTMSALADVITAPPATDDPTSARMQRIKDAVWASLDPDFWATDMDGMGGFTLTDQGNKVFDAHKRAVIELRMLFAAAGAQSGAAKSSIDYLLGADRLLARTAIDDAIADSGKPAEIARAEGEYRKGLNAMTNNNWDNAVDHFKKAWLHAMLAL